MRCSVNDFEAGNENDSEAGNEMYLDITNKQKFGALLWISDFVHKLVQYKSYTTYFKEDIKKALQDFIKRGTMRKKRSTNELLAVEVS